MGIPARYYKLLLRTTPEGTLAALANVLPNLVEASPCPRGRLESPANGSAWRRRTPFWRGTR